MEANTIFLSFHTISLKYEKSQCSSVNVPKMLNTMALQSEKTYEKNQPEALCTTLCVRNIKFKNVLHNIEFRSFICTVKKRSLCVSR